ARQRTADGLPAHVGRWPTGRRPEGQVRQVQWVLVGLVLDCGGREIVRVLAGLALVVLLALLLALSAPVAVIAGAPPTWLNWPPSPPGAGAPSPPGASAPSPP